MGYCILREFVVNAPLERTWKHLARVSEWPSWARHIQRLELSPSGDLTANSTVKVFLRNGVKGTLRMTQFDPPHRWRWDGPFLWFNSYVDHRFEAVDERRTKLMWLLGIEGFADSVIGPLLGHYYNGKWSRAIPLLTAEIEGKVQA